MIRAVEAAGGFATVLHKGHREAGAILLVLTEKGANSRVFEAMPSARLGREWLCTRHDDIENPYEFQKYLMQRGANDPDLWIVELDIAQGERFIPPQG